MTELLVILGALAAQILVPATIAVVILVLDAIVMIPVLIYRRQASLREPRLELSMRTLRRVTILSGLVLVPLFLVNFVFPSATLRWLLARSARASGIAADFEKLSGHLLLGRLALEGVTLKRPAGERSGLDLAVRRVDIDLELPSLVLGDRTLRSLFVEGVRGTFVTGSRKAGEAGGTLPSELLIRDLAIEDVQLVVDMSRAGGEPLPVEIDNFICRDFEKSWAVLHVLTASRLRGRIRGTAFTADLDAGGRGSVWDAKAIDVTILGALAGGIFEWLKEGTLDLHVDTRLPGPAAAADPPGVLMTWHLALTGVKVEAPPDRSRTKQVLSAPFTALLNAKLATPRELTVSLALERDGFRWKLSPDAAGLWEALEREFQTRVRKLKDS